MPSKSIFRQPGAKHFQLVHRSQRDPLIHDPEASQHVLKPVDKQNTHKGRTRKELETLISPEELAHDLSNAKLGEASLYGVYYDDTQYDYMQHLRPFGVQEDGVESILIEAPISERNKGKGKRKATIDDIFSDLPAEALPSTSELPRDYTSTQAVPESLSGLQPNMDPHLRQTLEALEDEAFINDDLADDFFGELIADGIREKGEDFDYDFHEGEDLEDIQYNDSEKESDWEARFASFKRDSSSQVHSSDSGVGSDEETERGDTIGDLPQLSVVGGKKRRKPASDASGYSMSSSSMFRNDNLTLLDERFDEAIKEYEDDDNPHSDSGDSDDEAPDLITNREDFNSMMEDFLNNYEVLGGKMKPVLPGDNAVDKLETMRRALGADHHIQDLVSDDDESASDIEETEDQLWDCETILTSYSNLENHPRVISAKRSKPVPKISLDPRTGLPSVSKGDDPPLSEDAKPSKMRSVTTSVIVRPRGESKEEKRARKDATKALRQTRRREKKESKEQFSNERKHQLHASSTQAPRGVRKL